MKKLYILLIFTFLQFSNHYLLSQDDQLDFYEKQNEIKKLLNFKNNNQIINKTQKKIKKPKKNTKTISLNYINEDLTNIINQLSALKRINVLFPQPPTKITTKLTFAKYDDVTVDEAWNFLITVLDLAGFTMVKKENLYQIVKNENATKEPLDLYVNSIYQLPNSDERIKYIYFLNNLDIHDTSSHAYTNLDQILKDMLSNEADGTTFILDGPTNTIIIIGKSNSIKGVMKIIQELDTAGFPETIEVVPLLYTKADFISKIVAQLLPSTPEPQFRYGPFPTKPSKTSAYQFSEQTKVVPIERTNSLAILGPPDSVEKLKNFITKYLDQNIESENSIIYVKTLQYLNADELAPVIQNLVKAKVAGAQAEAASPSGDTLANALIVPEKLVPASTISSTLSGETKGSPAQAGTSSAFVGGNRLIIAARSHDRQIIDKLVDQLDQPQLQVAIEVLVADLSVTDDHLLGTQLRNALNQLEPANVNFQAAHLTTTTDAAALPWLNFVNESDPTQGITPQGLASDLLAPTKNSPYVTSGGSVTAPVNIAKLADPGSTIISFKNGNGIAAILQVLDNYTSATILSQPFVITRNNYEAFISIARQQIFDMGIDPQSTGGPVVRKTIPLKADLSVKILPRVSNMSDINLQILVNVENFTTGVSANFNIDTRKVQTNANLKNKEVLVLGGLARVDTIDEILETPLLSKIPLIGYLFKRKRQRIEKRDLMIFIAPTLITPRIEGGMDPYTTRKTDFIKNEVLNDEVNLLGTNFDQLRDPVTRIFFTPLAKQVNKAIDYYTQQEVYVKGSEAKLVAGGDTSKMAIKEKVEVINENKSEEDDGQEQEIVKVEEDQENQILEENDINDEITEEIKKEDIALIDQDNQIVSKQEIITSSTTHPKSNIVTNKNRLVNELEKANNLKKILKNETNPLIR